MPKTYSQKEREYIINSLKKEAKECLKLYGVRKTTVDELVRRAKIPKGTFYIFFPSKEILLFQVINDWHDQLQEELISKTKELSGINDYEKFSSLLINLFKHVDESGFINLLTEGETDYLIRKLPEEVVKEHFLQDEMSLEKIIASFKGVKKRDVASFSAAFRAIFLSMKYKREIGEESFDEAIKILIKGVVIQLMEGNKHD